MLLIVSWAHAVSKQHLLLNSACGRSPLHNARFTMQGTRTTLPSRQWHPGEDETLAEPLGQGSSCRAPTQSVGLHAVTRSHPHKARFCGRHRELCLLRCAFTTGSCEQSVLLYSNSFLYIDLESWNRFTGAAGHVVKRAGQNARFSRPRDKFRRRASPMRPVLGGRGEASPAPHRQGAPRLGKARRILGG